LSELSGRFAGDGDNSVNDFLAMNCPDISQLSLGGYPIFRFTPEVKFSQVKDFKTLSLGQARL
jgi:hypothetical protein